MIWVRAPREPRAAGGVPPDRVVIFEIVPGAWVEGEAPPGAGIEVELVLVAGSGRVRYRAHAETGPGGSFGIRLPYPTDTPVSPEVRAAGAYELRAAGQNRRLELREADVRAGATVRGPSFSGGPT